MSDFTERRVVLELPGMDRVRVRRGVEFAQRDPGALTMDVYSPSATDEPGLPAVIFVSGYPDPGFRRAVGCSFKDLGAYVSWAQLVAASGMVGITYENVEPLEDLSALLTWIQDHATELGVDPTKLATWACSGNGPVALSQLADPKLDFRCAVFCYPYLMDVDGHTAIAETAAQFGFVPAMAGKSVDSLQPTPMLIVRAGCDEMPGLNELLNRFLGTALERNLPISVHNYPQGVHAFDLTDHAPGAKRAIHTVLQYLRNHLLDT